MLNVMNIQLKQIFAKYMMRKKNMQERCFETSLSNVK